jgi:UDP-glucose 4-epimerase
MVVTSWIEAARRGEAAARFGSEEATRDFVHVEDVARALDAAVQGGPDWAVVNIGSGCSTSLADVAQAVASSVGRPLELEDLPAQPGDAPSGPADTSQAEVEIGWRSTIDLATGLADWTSAVVAG